MFSSQVLKGRVALVGGASRGIGAAIAIELARAGARVVLMARGEKGLNEVKSQMQDPQTHVTLSFDLANTKELPGVMGRLIANVGPISVLVCNTGGPRPGPLMGADVSEFQSAYDQHVLSSQIMVQKLVPGMKDLHYGRILNVISTSVKIPIPNLGVSNTVRAAVASWAKTLSGELAPFGITVNNLLPGYTQTERLESLKEASAKRANVTVEEMEKDWIKSIPAARFGKPQEIAQAAAFLASPFASYITGINLPVDGGRTGCL